MMILFQSIFLFLVLLLALPVTLFALQILVALPEYKKKDINVSKRPTIVVLIPAHNESSNLIPTINSVKAQLAESYRVIVIADNCNDDTAQVATASGVEVLERFDVTKRGKGYALDFGVRFIEKQQFTPDVVIVIDADCLLTENTLSRLAYEAIRYGKPIQSLNLMKAQEGAGVKTKIAEFAWIVKNLARPLGFMRLGLPCQLMGTGMAFPWKLIQQAEIASGHIVEDLKLGLDFANMGLAPQFCPDVAVISLFPLNNDGVKTQRTRWEHGHLGMILRIGPNLILESIKSKNLSMLALTLDMCVPPLALLTLLVFSLATIGLAIMFLSQTIMPWILGVLLLLILCVSVLLAWARFARKIISFSSLVYIPIYALAKIPMYLKFLLKRQVEWVRSRRD